MLTAAGNEELAIRTLKSSIKDYVRKDKLNATMLAEAIISPYETHHGQRNIQAEVQESEAQHQKDRAELEKEAAILNSQIQSCLNLIDFFEDADVIAVTSLLDIVSSNSSEYSLVG
ncbi:MAG: hypothetical protein ACI9ZT_000480 [Gammaproteobacteria bacterium]